MTLRIMLAALAGLALAACNNQNNTSDQNDDTEVTLPPDGKVATVKFDVQVGEKFEPCLVTLACEGETVTKSSTETFEVNPEANCTVTIGTTAVKTRDGRPTHQSADGMTWTYSAPITGFEDGTTEVLVANWYFEAQELRCSFWDSQVVINDVFVDSENTFEIPSIASDGSWIQVLGRNIGYGGRALDRGWGIFDVTIGTNSASFSVDKVSSTFDVDCTW